MSAAILGFTRINVMARRLQRSSVTKEAPVNKTTQVIATMIACSVMAACSKPADDPHPVLGCVCDNDDQCLDGEACVDGTCQPLPTDEGPFHVDTDKSTPIITTESNPLPSPQCAGLNIVPLRPVYSDSDVVDGDEKATLCCELNRAAKLAYVLSSTSDTAQVYSFKMQLQSALAPRAIDLSSISVCQSPGPVTIAALEQQADAYLASKLSGVSVSGPQGPISLAGVTLSNPLHVDFTLSGGGQDDTMASLPMLPAVRANPVAIAQFIAAGASIIYYGYQLFKTTGGTTVSRENARPAAGQAGSRLNGINGLVVTAANIEAGQLAAYYAAMENCGPHAQAQNNVELLKVDILSYNLGNDDGDLKMLGNWNYRCHNVVRDSNEAKDFSIWTVRNFDISMTRDSDWIHLSEMNYEITLNNFLAHSIDCGKFTVQGQQLDAKCVALKFAGQFWYETRFGGRRTSTYNFQMNAGNGRKWRNGTAL